ncbi:uncharacterized protein [Coffea arabica]|uniref:Uncharacterized protein n=1 Tax=Coffea arabica TaxID=13443 RepID=A0ABM4VTJ5_COFAR
MGRKTRISNVDPQRYSYMQPLNDILEQALSDMPENVNLLLHMRHGIPKAIGSMDIIDDQSVKEMFKVHKSELVINLFVLDMDIIPNEVGNNLNGQSFQENLGINNNAGRQIQYFQNSGDDDEYYHSCSDESWKHHLGSDKEDGSDDDRVSLASSDSSDLNFSDFEENEGDDIVADSDSESEKIPDPIKEVMKFLHISFFCVFQRERTSQMVGPSTGKSSKIGKGNASANAQSASAANTNQNSQTQASVSIEAIANMDSQSLTNSFSMRF